MHGLRRQGPEAIFLLNSISLVIPHIFRPCSPSNLEPFDQVIDADQGLFPADHVP
jgi:hypothetical protein